MKRMLALCALGLLAASPLLAGKPGPACAEAPTDVLSRYNACNEDAFGYGYYTVYDNGPEGCAETQNSSAILESTSIPAESLLITWTAPSCGDIAKYAVEVEVHYDGGECGDPAYTETFRFTTLGPETSLLIPLADLNYDAWVGPGRAVVKVKALTPAPSNGKAGGRSGNASQNIPFSVPTSRYVRWCPN